MMRAAGRLLALGTLGVVTAALAASPAAADERDGGGGLTVTVGAVSFDASRLRDASGWLGYVVTAPDGSHARNLGDRYSPEDAADGVLELDVPQRGPYGDGYCVTWVLVTGIDRQFAGWNGDAAVCTTTAAPAPTPPPPAAPTEAPVQAPVVEAPAPVVEAPAPTAQAPEPEVTEEPTPEPTTAAPVEPTPTETPTTVPTEPSRAPLTSAAERMAPPPPAQEAFPTLAVVGVGGLVAAAAGGAILLLRRVG